MILPQIATKKNPTKNHHNMLIMVNYQDTDEYPHMYDLNNQSSLLMYIPILVSQIRFYCHSPLPWLAFE